MGLHKDFPTSPFSELDPTTRWFPADEELRDKGSEKLLPPLVTKLREEVKSWRDSGYVGVSDTTRSLLNYWFLTKHPRPTTNNPENCFEYFFAQRESVETIVYLYEVVECRNPQDLLKYDIHGSIVISMFEESWFRLVTKQATGTGKTKVLSVLLVWSYFHKTYEDDSDLSRNFLLITPNIIVLDRIRTDFDGLKIFFGDPLLPPNGYDGQNWNSDFQLTLHIQDEVGTLNKKGNIFLTNIHRVYDKKDSHPSFEDENTMDYFLGDKPVTKTQDNKVVLRDIVRDIDELLIMNDEAHHIHDSKLSWFKSIQDIHNNLLQKNCRLSLQIDVTATPKHENGNIFVQTISDYPLVEAIAQRVVKQPVLPDSASRGKLTENQSVKFSEKYRDYIHLGYIEWKKSYEEHKKLGKKAVMFVMVDDTKNCDDVADYLRTTYKELSGDSTFVIHTKRNGEINENVTGKKEQELKELRKFSNEIDNLDNPCKAVISVLMLKEGWDVQNVTTIVGLRPYTSKSNILPEQTLGRGLRRMYFGSDCEEYVSVVGTDAFLEFVESIRNEGVILDRKPMGGDTPPKVPLIIEIDKENKKKDLDKLDIKIPVLSPRIRRDYKNLNELNPQTFKYKVVSIVEFSEEEKKEITFREITKGKVSHTTYFDKNFIPDPTSIIGHFTRNIMKELRLYGGQEVLYESVKDFITNYLFGKSVDLYDLNIIRNLSEVEPNRTITDTFKKYINELSVVDKGNTEILDYIRVGNTKTFTIKDTEKFYPKKSVFNRIVGDSHFELIFSSTLDSCIDVISFVKNFQQINFKMEYINYEGGIGLYYPDFVVKISETEHWIVETKGLENFNDPLKIERLSKWCKDATEQTNTKWDYLYVMQEDWDKLEETPNSFSKIIDYFGNRNG